eukprot:jgi/Psemu1/34824/gm1.34824_g
MEDVTPARTTVAKPNFSNCNTLSKKPFLLILVNGKQLPKPIKTTFLKLTGTLRTSVGNTGVFIITIPTTSNPNRPEEVRLAKQINRLIGDRAHFGDGVEEFDLEGGYKNTNISGGEGDDFDISDDNNIPLCQPSQPTQPAQ